MSLTDLTSPPDAALGRRITLIWELTQSTIAMAVVLTVLWVDAHVAMRTGPISDGQSTGLMQINVLGALVVGFYFGATNHQRGGRPSALPPLPPGVQP